MQQQNPEKAAALAEYLIAASKKTLAAARQRIRDRMDDDYLVSNTDMEALLDAQQDMVLWAWIERGCQSGVTAAEAIEEVRKDCVRHLTGCSHGSRSTSDTANVEENARRDAMKRFLQMTQGLAR